MRNTVYYHTRVEYYFSHNFPLFLKFFFQVFPKVICILSYIYRERVIVIFRKLVQINDSSVHFILLNRWGSMQYSFRSSFISKLVVVKDNFPTCSVSVHICHLLHPSNPYVSLGWLVDLFYILNVLSMGTIFNFLLSRHWKESTTFILFFSSGKFKGM